MDYLLLSHDKDNEIVYAKQVQILNYPFSLYFGISYKEIRNAKLYKNFIRVTFQFYFNTVPLSNIINC